MNRRLWIGILIAYAALRSGLLFHPGYVYDLNAYKRWALRAGQNGLARIYATSDMDYPPLYAWILYPLGEAYDRAFPEASRAMRDSRLLTVLVKLPPLLFDLGIAWLLYRVGKRAERGAKPKRRRRWSFILPAAYLCNPAVLFDTAYWGQPDSIHSFFILAAFQSLGGLRLLARPEPGIEPADGRTREPKGTRIGSAWPGWVFLTLATLMKPLGAPFFPLFLVLSLVWHGAAATAAGAGAAALVSAVVFSPFLFTGQIGPVIERVVGDVALMPYTSVNGHNLWWLLGAWKPADTPALGPITLTQCGLTLFAGVYLALLWRAVRLARRLPSGPTSEQGMILAMAVGFSFFMLSTHMHENHLFAVIPLSLSLIPLDREGETRWARLAGALSLGVLLNLLLHDLTFPERFPFTLGGPTGVQNPHLKRPFYLAELGAIWVSVLFNLAVFGWFLFALFRRGPRGLLDGPEVAPKVGVSGRGSP